MKRSARDRDTTRSTDSTRITVDACEPHLGPLRDDLATDSGPAPETVRNVPAGDRTVVEPVVEPAPITLRMLPEAPRTVRLQLVPFASENAQAASPKPAEALPSLQRREALPSLQRREPPQPAPASMHTMASAPDVPAPAKRRSGPPPLPVEVLAEPAVVVRPSISSEALERHAQTGPRQLQLPPVASTGPRSVRPARERAPGRAQLLHGLVAATVAAALLVMGVSIVLFTPSDKRAGASPSAALAGENVQSAPVEVTPAVPTAPATQPALATLPAAATTAHTVVLSSPTLVVGAKAPKSAHSAPAPTPLASPTAPAPTPLPEPTPLGTRFGIDLK